MYNGLEKQGTEANHSEEEIAFKEGAEFHFDFVIIDSAIYGEFAIVDVEVTAQANFKGETTGTDDGGKFESVELVRENDTWLICDNTDHW